MLHQDIWLEYKANAELKIYEIDNVDSLVASKSTHINRAVQ